MSKLRSNFLSLAWHDLVGVIDVCSGAIDVAVTCPTFPPSSTLIHFSFSRDNLLILFICCCWVLEPRLHNLPFLIPIVSVWNGRKPKENHNQTILYGNHTNVPCGLHKSSRSTSFRVVWLPGSKKCCRCTITHQTYWLVVAHQALPHRCNDTKQTLYHCARKTKVLPRSLVAYDLWPIFLIYILWTWKSGIECILTSFHLYIIPLYYCQKEKQTNENILHSICARYVYFITLQGRLFRVL